MDTIEMELYLELTDYYFAIQEELFDNILLTPSEKRELIDELVITKQMMDFLLPILEYYITQ